MIHIISILSSWFVPPVPVGDATREEIYQTYRAAPQEWTPRKLAEKFQLSVLRVEAILRLKHLEKRQVEQVATCCFQVAIVFHI